MTNYDKFKEKVDWQARAGRKLAVRKDNNEPTMCAQLVCKDCKFYSSKFCSEQAIEWLKEEYIERKKEIEVGDSVKIIDISCCYTTYKNWVLNNITDKIDMLSYDIKQTPTNGDIGIVIGKAMHESNDKMLYYIKLKTDRCYLISQDGIKLNKEE